MIELKDHAKVPVAQQVAAGTGQVVDTDAFEMHLAGVGLVERAEQVQQRALAATALADDRQELAFVYLHVDALQHRNAQCSAAIALKQIARGQHGLLPSKAVAASSGELHGTIRGICVGRLLIAQGPYGVETSRPPGGHDAGEHGNAHGTQRDPANGKRFDDRWYLRQEVDRRVEHRLSGDLADEVGDLVDVVDEQQTEDGSRPSTNEFPGRGRSRGKMPITPSRDAPSDLKIPMSRVFSTTIMQKIAKMPKPATAMIRNSKMLRTTVSI